jgi:hypothetical protein
MSVARQLSETEDSAALVAAPKTALPLGPPFRNIRFMPGSVLYDFVR